MLYLGNDPALFNLVSDPDARRSLLKNPNVQQFENDYGTHFPQGSTVSTNIKYHTIDNQNSSYNKNGSSIQGNDMYEVVFNITLDPLSHVKGSQSAGVNAFDGSETLDGLWANPTGMSSGSGGSSGGGSGFIHIESNGIHIKFTEVPTMRQWGTTEALLIGGKLRYADFRDITSLHHYTPSSSSSSTEDLSLLLAQDAPQTLVKLGLDTGSIFVNKGSNGMSIQWEGKNAWFKQPKPLKYRFLKLTVKETRREKDERREIE